MYQIDKNFKELIIGSESSDYIKLKKAFEKTLNAIDDERLVDMIRVFPTIKPTIKFKTLYYLLEEFKNEKTSERDYEIMRGYLEKDIDVFMLVNYLRENNR
ncbi:hypothetical protein IJI89_01235 [Candidatus Saccharibacteria bacterium]|nr:hypothetical protein [Candidatus Saccharibacteria bacterium]